MRDTATDAGADHVETEADRPRGDRSGRTRRRILQAAGGLTAAGVLGVGGWLRRATYLGVVNDRSDLVSPASPRGSRVSGPSAETVPADGLLAALARFSDRRSDTGLQACVRFGDGTVWRGVVGNADHDGGDPLTLDHHLYVGSVTKFFTATLVLREVGRGTVSLSESIDRWFDFDYAEDVTVRMLLNHTSGIPNYTEDLWFGLRYFGFPTKRWRPSELVDVVRGESPEFDPGTRHLYSNTNYLLLGRILERATGSRYRDLLRDLVRNDLGFDHTYYLDYPDDAPIANAYDESIFGLGRRELTAFRTSLETGGYAAGGVLSRAPDVAGFLDSVFGGAVLDADVLGEMRTFVDAPDEDVPTQVGYGLGVRHLRIDGEDLYGHTGTIPGYSALAMYHDRPRYAMAVVGNVSTIDQSGLCAALQRVVLSDYY